MSRFKPSSLNCVSTIVISLSLAACSSNEPASPSSRSPVTKIGTPVYLHMEKGRSFTSVSNRASTSSGESEAFRLNHDGKISPNFSPDKLNCTSKSRTDKYGKLCGSYFINQSVTPGTLVGTALAAALTSGITLLGGVSKVPKFNQAGFNQAVRKSNVETYIPMILAFKAKVDSQSLSFPRDTFLFTKETLNVALSHPSGSTNYLLNNMLERNKSGSALKLVANPSDKQIMMVLESEPSYIENMSMPKDKFQRFIVGNNSKNIRYIKNPAEHIQLMAVEKDVNTFTSIASPTPKVIAYALSKKGTLISRIKNPSVQLQRIAVTQNSKAISEINQPAEDIQLMAVERDVNTFTSIKSPTPKVMAYALSKKGIFISHIKSPSAQLQRIAVTQNPQAIDKISKPAESVQLYVLKTKGASFLHDYVSESLMANSVLKDPAMSSYLAAYKGAASRRRSSSSSNSGSYGASSSSSYGSSNSYSPPQRTCRNVTRVRTVRLMGGRPGQTTQERYNEEVCS